MTYSHDIYKRTALHYAVKSESHELVELILGSGDNYNVNDVDEDGHSPISYCLRGEKVKKAFYNRTFGIYNIFKTLVDQGADVNIVYPESTYKPAHKFDELDE